MSAHSFLWVGGVGTLAYREGYFPEISQLFREEDRAYSNTGLFVGYQVTISQMIDRLNLMGIDLKSVKVGFMRAFDKLPEDERPAKFDFDTWIENKKEEVASGGSGDLNSDDDWIEWHVDPRYIVRALVEICGDPEGVVYWDLGELTSRGFLDPDKLVCTDSFRELFDGLRTALPVLVLTEGSTDAEFLRGATRVLYPHLYKFLSYTDFTGPVEGGAAALMRTVNAFIASGVPNRIIAIFDNDTAAADVISSTKLALPDNYRIIQYPAIDHAASYPTFGPSGTVTMNINGSAGSLELYLGKDLLLQEDGSYTPVQWTGYSKKQGRYQGELIDKVRIQKLFRKRLNTALVSGQPQPDEDWTGLKAILDTVRHAFT